MHIGQDDQLVVTFENAKRVRSVRKSRPQRHRATEGEVQFARRRQIKMRGNAFVHLGEQFRVEHRRGLALLPGFQGCEGLQAEIAGHALTLIEHQ